jgi:thiol:disulfide interchange protein DsbD
VQQNHHRCWRRSILLLGLWGIWISLPLWAQESRVAETTQPLDWLSGVVSRQGLWVGLVAVFLGGLALNFTPCVYPMIPVTLAFFSGQAAGSLRRAFLLAFLYVLGISFNYALLGVLAAKTGALFGSWLQQPAVLTGSAAVIVALSLSMFGLYDLRVPHTLTRRLGHTSAGLWGAFVMGLVVGLVAAPCIGPFVLGLLLLVSQLANPAAGFLLFFVLGLGMGLPYMVLGVAANRVGRLPKAGMWLVWSKQVLGVVLLGLALYFVRPLLPAHVVQLIVTGLLLGAGVYLGWLDRTEALGQWFVWGRRLVGSVLVLVAIAVGWPRPQAGPPVVWAPYSEAIFEQAQRDRRPILIDIYADWCLPCVEMDHVTFRHPDVVQALGSVATLRLDVTSEVPPEGEALLERHHIYGAPTVLVFDRSGNERKDLRLTGFVKPDEFLQRLKQIQ